MQTIDEATTRVADAAKRGLKQIKARAERPDRVGEATYRTLELVSDGLGATAKALRQLGKAVEPPSRGQTPATQPAAARSAARPRRTPAKPA
jgi:hypothetical protein